MSGADCDHVWIHMGGPGDEYRECDVCGYVLDDPAPAYEDRFDACPHPWDRKYVVNRRGVVCIVCDPSWTVVAPD